ncbi:septum formation initiator family protein [Cellulomonas sp. PhB143]|uniref:FtsB family cell division protein n=1 Tax=Cellulomonas sp. PhB143 TaxID=2485186 RepID=UPI000F48D631|nr:septum formation initiator family protein [Cellulomonas sp. PhB143]ROS78663.1 cell division protein FtsB [Cellulomonas sp. PhB143]
MPANRRPTAPAAGARPRGRSPAGSGRSPRTGATRAVPARPAPAAAARPGTSGTTSSGTARAASSGTTAPPAPHEKTRSRFGFALPERLTVRSMVLTVVILVAVAMLLPTARAYVNQAGELHQVESQLAAAKQERADLEVELDRWDDRSYVVAQARDRLSFVMPGETAYRVLDPGVVRTTHDPATGHKVGTGPVDASDGSAPWYSSVWSSVQLAGEDGSRASDNGGDRGSAP